MTAPSPGIAEDVRADLSGLVRRLRRLGTRPGDVPLGHGGGDRLAPWIIAPMAYLATLALAAAIAMAALVQHWETGLSGTLTVQVPAAEDASATAARVAAVVAALEAMPGIASARPLASPEIQRLLEPWLGDGALIPDLPLPVLIDVHRAAGAPLDLAALRGAVSRAAPGTTVDDAATWLGDLIALAGTVRLFAGVILGLIAVAAVATVIAVTSAGLGVHRQVIDVLHIMGAPDRYIARQFERYALELGAVGGGIGLALGAVTLVVLDHVASRAEASLLPALSFGAGQWAWLLLVPPAVAALAMLTARLTVLLALSRLP